MDSGGEEETAHVRRPGAILRSGDQDQGLYYPKSTLFSAPRTRILLLGAKTHSKHPPCLICIIRTLSLDKVHAAFMESQPPDVAEVSLFLGMISQVHKHPPHFRGGLGSEDHSFVY